MFVRTKVFKNRDGSTRTYLQIVKGERVGGKVRQVVLANLGRLDKLENGALDRLLEGLARFSRYRLVEEKAREPQAGWTKAWGPALVFGRLWEELGLPVILERLLGDTAAVSDYPEAVFAMVLDRLGDPASKLRVSEWIKTVYRPEWERLELQHFYRALDFLTEHKAESETAVYDRASDLFNLKLDLVLWDTTSTYFEGRAAEGLAEFGFSKDKRPDRVQIMVGVLMSRDGFPIAHEVFPGNTARSKPLWYNNFRFGAVKVEPSTRLSTEAGDSGRLPSNQYGLSRSVMDREALQHPVQLAKTRREEKTTQARLWVADKQRRHRLDVEPIVQIHGDVGVVKQAKLLSFSQCCLPGYVWLQPLRTREDYGQQDSSGRSPLEVRQELAAFRAVPGNHKHRCCVDG
jgi:hypothetical protein